MRALALILALLFGVAHAAAPAFLTQATTQFPGGFALYPFVEENPTGGDTLSGTMVTALTSPYSSGAKVSLCWVNEEPSPGTYTWFANSTSSLNLLAANLGANQHIIIGIKAGGACSPPWLNTSYGVPMPTLYLQSGTNCNPTNFPASYDAAYITRYLAITQALWNAMATVTVAHDPTHTPPYTLQDHVTAIVNAAMGAKNTTEWGLFQNACTGTDPTTGHAIATTTMDVATVWSSLAAPDNYQPQKVRAAYATLLTGLFGIIPSNRSDVSVVQAVLETDTASWPQTDESGVPLPLTATYVPLMDSSIMDVAAATWGSRMIFGWNAASMAGPADNSPIFSHNVLEAASYGARVEWEMNGKATGGITSCKGYHDTAPASPMCFAAIQAYGAMLTAQFTSLPVAWYEPQPNDFLSSSGVLWNAAPLQ